MMADSSSNRSVNHDITEFVDHILDLIDCMNTICDHISVKLDPRHKMKFKKVKNQSIKNKQKKRRIFSSSEDDSSSSSSDDSVPLDDNTTLVGEDSDEDEQKILRNRHGPRTRNELLLDDLPPIENLTITLSDETPIERLGHVRHIVDGKLVIIESLLHSPPLNDDSVLFNGDRRSIGLIYETFGPVEKPYYSIRYNDINCIRQRQIELNQEVFYAPKETTYTKYVFVQELRALKGSDASWEDDNEPPQFAIDYSDDEEERAAKASQRRKRNCDESDEQMSNDAHSVVSNNTNLNYNRGRGRGRGRGHNRAYQQNTNYRPPPNIPNWFQNTSNATSFQQRATSSYSYQSSTQNNSSYQSSTQNNSNQYRNMFVPLTSSASQHSGQSMNSHTQTTQQGFQGNISNHSVFPWM